MNGLKYVTLKKNSLLALRFDHLAEARGNVTVTADQDNAKLLFRIANASGFETISISWAAEQVHANTLDELAKMIVAQPHRFI